MRHRIRTVYFRRTQCSANKNFKKSKAAGLDEIPQKVRKIRKFNNLLLQYCNAVYNQNTIERWTKGCILPFPKRRDHEIAKNYRGITLTSIATKIYNALLLNCSQPEIEKILRKNHNGFQRTQSKTSQILTIHRILGFHIKNLEVVLLSENFSKGFDSINIRKIEQILLADGFPKETVTAIMMLYENTKVKVCPLDGHTGFFDIVASVLQGDILALYLFIIYLDYVLQMSIDLMKENGFTLKKARSRRYQTQTIMMQTMQMT